MMGNFGKDFFNWSSDVPFTGFSFGSKTKSKFFEFGEVRLAILSLLAEGPKHGYQLMKEMQERSGGTYKASAGSIYPTLQQLEDEGLIESDRADGRRIFKLTVAGRHELEKDPEAVRRIWQRAEKWEGWSHWTGPETFGFLGEAASLMKSVLRAAKTASGHPEREDRVRNTIRRMITELDSMFR